MAALRRGDEFLVLLDVPGAHFEDIDVTVGRNVVGVRARRASKPRRVQLAVADPSEGAPQDGAGSSATTRSETASGTDRTTV